MNNKPKRILGIDPGTILTGYGLIEHEGNSLSPIDYGCIRPPPKMKLSDRYHIIFESVLALIERYLPSILVVETQFVQKNVQSALKLGMARGVALIAAKSKGLQVFEYAPTEAKKAVVGRGSASKVQVQGMVGHLLRLPHPPEPEDAADALALAICFAHTAPHLLHKHEI